MVAMEMRDQDEIDVVGRDLAATQRGQNTRSAIHQRRVVASLHDSSRMEAASRAECISRPESDDAHAIPGQLLCELACMCQQARLDALNSCRCWDLTMLEIGGQDAAHTGTGGVSVISYGSTYFVAGLLARHRACMYLHSWAV